MAFGEGLHECLGVDTERGSERVYLGGNYTDVKLPTDVGIARNYAEMIPRLGVETMPSRLAFARIANDR
jgi:hypothetical protein